MLNNTVKISHDGKVHNPPGGGSSVFKKEYADYIVNYLPKDKVRISAGALPNSSPHFGTTITFSLAFSLAQRLKNLGKDVTVVVGMVDTAALSADESKFENVEYQKSIACTGAINNYIDDFKELLERLSVYFDNVNYEITNQSNFSSHRKASEIIRKIVDEKEKIGQLLFPETKLLGLRSACPQCGLADRHGLKNHYESDIINFFCPHHGWHSINLKENSLQKLEYETPLRNLVRGLLYTEDNRDESVPYSWLRVTGSDYAGFYQEHLFYKGAAILGIDIINSPLIVYSPLVVDWAGVKLSKSILVEGGYNYLTEQGLDYLINYRKFKVKFGNDGLQKLFKEVNLWLEEPNRLFRNYTIFYFAELFKEEKVKELEQQMNSLQIQEAQIEATPK